jgi:hypothetical protein
VHDNDNPALTGENNTDGGNGGWMVKTMVATAKLE